MIRPTCAVTLVPSAEDLRAYARECPYLGWVPPSPCHQWAGPEENPGPSRFSKVSLGSACAPRSDGEAQRCEVGREPHDGQDETGDSEGEATQGSAQVRGDEDTVWVGREEKDADELLTSGIQ